MNTKAAGIGISAALIGGLVALVGAITATKGKPRPAPAAPSGDGHARTLGGANPATMPGGRGAQPTTNPTTVAPQPVAPGEGHAAPDLAAGADLGPDHRAPVAFRPDIDAPMTPEEREALRPALGAPSLTGVSTTQPSGG